MNELLQLMHDTMSPVNTIKGAVDLLKKSLLPNGEFSKEDTLKLLNGIEDRANKLNEVLDAYYIKQKDKK
jgi:K+-sensing histidine kinase KdpD